ncbi:MAG: hypothetical protein K6A82_08820 [Prevotella sp.]|nr:hypothetical protein [Prevotella sp.]
MKKTLAPLPVLIILLTVLCSCNDFVFFDVTVDDNENPLKQLKTPTTSADLYKAPVVTNANLPNPDATGAFANWATCLVMIKEGHPHGNGKMHGNYVYKDAPWKQEEFVIIHNTPDGIKVETDRESTATAIEKEEGREGPAYLRIIGGKSKLWGLCLYFFDRDGRLINDAILNQSDQYQIFFTVSDVDDKGQPYSVMDVRYHGSDGDGNPLPPVPAASFDGKDSFEERREMTPKLLDYVYRDTWTHDDMGDGVRDLFNIRLLPPYSRTDFHTAKDSDKDCVGLKGHLRFDNTESPLPWPMKLTNGLTYRRNTYLLPQFYLAVRVMKCAKGKKSVILLPEDQQTKLRKYMCADFFAPKETSGWKEVIRFNLPMKVYASSFDSDPTNPDAYEPYYYSIAREIGMGKDVRAAFELVKNIKVHGNGGGLGYGSWFL